MSADLASQVGCGRTDRRAGSKRDVGSAAESAAHEVDRGVERCPSAAALDRACSRRGEPIRRHADRNAKRGRPDAPRASARPRGCKKLIGGKWLAGRGLEPLMPPVSQVLDSESRRCLSTPKRRSYVYQMCTRVISPFSFSPSREKRRMPIRWAIASGGRPPGYSESVGEGCGERARVIARDGKWGSGPTRSAVAP